MLPLQREVLVTTAGMRALAPSIARRSAVSNNIPPRLVAITPPIMTFSSASITLPQPPAAVTLIRPSAPGPVGATLLRRPLPPITAVKVIEVVDADVAAFLRDLDN